MKWTKDNGRNEYHPPSTSRETNTFSAARTHQLITHNVMVLTFCVTLLSIVSISFIMVRWSLYVDIRISIIRLGKCASSPVWEDVCEGEESDGDEDEGGVPGDQSADQVAVHCTHQYRRYAYVPHLKYRLQVWRTSICFAIKGPIISPRRVILYSVADLALAPGLLSAECGDSEYFLQLHKWHVNKIPNTIYLEFQLLLFPAGTPPQGKILFLSPKIRFLVYFLNLQNKG